MKIKIDATHQKGFLVTATSDFDTKKLLRELQRADVEIRLVSHLSPQRKKNLLRTIFERIK